MTKDNRGFIHNLAALLNANYMFYPSVEKYVTSKFTMASCNKHKLQWRALYDWFKFFL